MPLVIALWCVAALLGTACLGIGLGSMRERRRGHLRDLSVGIAGGAGGRARSSHGRHDDRRRPSRCRSACLGWGRISAWTCWRRFFWSWSISGPPPPASSPSGTAPTTRQPARVLPFYPAFLAGMNLVVLADDAFTFLVSWEFMSLTSWALVMAHHRVRDNLQAGYVYLVMASFGTLCLLLGFGLLTGPDGNYAFAAIRAMPPSAGIAAGVLMLVAGRRRIEGRPGAAACLAAARASGRAQPRLRLDERRHDQGRGLRLRAHRARPVGTAGLVVEHGGALARRHHRRHGGALRFDAERPQAAARLFHGGEHRHRLHRARAWRSPSRRTPCRRRRRWRSPPACSTCSIIRCSRACCSSAPARC